MRKMYDSVTPENIPKDAAIVGGYLNGRYAWSASDWARFPNSVHVRISVRAAFLDGHVLDVEPGDATPAQSVGWVKARRAAGADPSIYCNRSTWPQVRAAFATAHEPEPHYWIATASGKFEIPAGAVAAQYLLDVDGVDRSAVADHWPGVDSAQPHLDNKFPNQEEEEMSVLVPANCTPAADGSLNGDDYVAVPVNGKTALYLAPAYGRRVRVIELRAVKDNADGKPQFGKLEPGLEGPWFANSDQPGPIPLPTGTRHAVIRYAADHAFTAWSA